MDPETGSEKNLAKMLFRQINSTQQAVERASRLAEPVAWDSETAARLDDLASGNKHRIFRNNSLHPDVFIIGYQLDSLDKTASYLEAIARKGLFQECAFLVEGYDNEAPMISKTSPVTNPKLNSLYQKYRIKPRGRDSFSLREEQYAKFKEIMEDVENPNVPLKIQQTMACLLQREREYFVPAIVEHAQEKPVIFLTTMVHALSFHLPQLIKNKGFRYAVFVPNKNIK